MILRMWKARCATGRAGEYIQHATQVVFPKVRAIEGYRGEYLLRREVEDGIELVVLPIWDSMEAVSKFAAPEPNKAVVAPEARAA